MTVAIVDAYASPTIVSDATTYAQRNDPDPPVQEVEVLPEGLPAVLRRRPQQVRRVGLVRRGDARRRGRAHHGPGRQHLLRRRQELQQRRLRPGPQRPRRRPQGRHRLQLVRQPGREHRRPTGTPRSASSRRPRSRGSASTSPPATAGTRATPAYGGPVPSADFPASSPLVTAVGGTSLGVDANGGVALEQGWTTGISDVRPRDRHVHPGPQRRLPLRRRWRTEPGVRAARLPEGRRPEQPRHGHSASRSAGSSPTSGMVGDPNTGFLVGQTQTFPEGVSYDEYRIGGTSLSSPLFAGVMALADQQAGRPPRLRQPVPLLAGRLGRAAGHHARDRSPPSCARNYVNSVDASAGFANPTVRTIDADLQSLRTLNGLRHADRARARRTAPASSTPAERQIRGAAHPFRRMGPPCRWSHPRTSASTRPSP